MKTEGWPILKILFHFLRFFMPIEFTIVGEFDQWPSFFTPSHAQFSAVAFFDINFTQAVCLLFDIYALPQSDNRILSNVKTSTYSSLSAPLSS